MSSKSRTAYRLVLSKLEIMQNATSITRVCDTNFTRERCVPMERAVLFKYFKPTEYTHSLFSAKRSEIATREQ
jgi:hypothetical protein